MATLYSRETRKILRDFLETLAAKDEIDPLLLADLQQMVTDGVLGDADRITQAIENLTRQPDQ